MPSPGIITPGEAVRCSAGSLSLMSTSPRSDGDAPAPDMQEARDPIALPAVRTWLLDGFNIIHTVLLGGRDRRGWWRSEHRRALLDRVSRLRPTGARAEPTLIVVFDGGQPADPEHAPAHSRLRVEFAPDADAFILREAKRALARSGGAHGSVGVVTADRKLGDRCCHAGAVIVAPREFLAQCPSAEGSAIDAPVSE